jgi:hypothetical protein
MVLFAAKRAGEVSFEPRRLRRGQQHFDIRWLGWLTLLAGLPDFTYSADMVWCKDLI